MILSGDDPVTRAAAVRHLSSLAALDARLIQEYRGTSERLADRKSREEAQQRELASLHEEAKREQAEVDRDAAKRRTLLAKVRDERAYHERVVGELTEAAQRLEAFIRELQAKQRKLAKAPPPKSGIEPPSGGFGSLRGRLPWPTEGKIVTGFGAQVHPRFGTRTFRNGVDIEAGFVTEHQGTGRRRRSVPGARHVARQHGGAAHLSGVGRQLHGADDQRVRGSKLFGRRDQTEAAQNVGRPALERTQRQCRRFA